MRKKNAYIWCVIGVVLVCGIVLLWYNRPGPSFDSKVWKAADSLEAFEARRKMLPSLRKQYQLIGMTHEEVVDLLGEPERTKMISGDDYMYCLGPQQDFPGIDLDYLALFFDGNGRVREVRFFRR